MKTQKRTLNILWGSKWWIKVDLAIICEEDKMEGLHMRTSVVIMETTS